MTWLDTYLSAFATFWTIFAMSKILWALKRPAPNSGGRS